MPENNNARILSGVITGLLATAVTAHGHPVHATFAEATWNPRTKSIEVALRVRCVDLEKPFQKSTGKPLT